ncbi:universal stress protein [Tomitella fengzijianii]|nr:universal stress protein [Tomitella fengzijianii]
MDKCIVVGFDGLPAGRAALAKSAELAAALGAWLAVVHVPDTADEPVDPDSPAWAEGRDAAVAAVRASAEHELAATAVRWRFDALAGPPAAVLGSVADEEHADMIVLGAPRAGLAAAMERLLGDAVAVQLLRHGHRPVLVVPEHSR